MFPRPVDPAASHLVQNAEDHRVLGIVVKMWKGVAGRSPNNFVGLSGRNRIKTSERPVCHAFPCHAFSPSVMPFPLNYPLSSAKPTYVYQLPFAARRDVRV